MATDAVVNDGVVELFGSIADERQRAALMLLAQKTSGVRIVLDRLTFTEPTEKPGAREETRAQLIERLIDTNQPDDR